MSVTKKVFLSPYDDPYTNLAIEDYLLHSITPNEAILFFYINRPCVVLGRFQNPWKEAHLPFLASNSIQIVRRQSGGGCVYHDPGNLNISFIRPQRDLAREENLDLVIKAIQTLKVNLVRNSRFDLRLEGKKVSGSAFKQKKESSLHHLTLLINSDTLRLNQALHSDLASIETKATKSVRSQVNGLIRANAEISIEKCYQAIAKEFSSSEIINASLQNQSQDNRNKYDCWDWTWGETPRFELEFKGGWIKIHKSLVEGVSEEAFKNLVGFRCQHPEMISRIHELSGVLDSDKKGLEKLLCSYSGAW